MKKNKWLSVIVVKAWWRVLISFLFLLSVPMTTLAVDFYVATDGFDTNDCQSGTTPCLTIDAAMGKASDNDIINIASGTYNENVYIVKNLSLVGAGTASTIIDGGSSGRVIWIQDTSRIVSLEKLTLQNGVPGSGSGGGILNAGALTLDQIKIINSSTTILGGGILNSGTLTITNSTISNNSTPNSGGGIYNVGTLSLDLVEMTNNQALHGGAISNDTSGVVIISNGNLSGNSANFGAAIFNDGGQVTLDKTTISANSGTGDVLHSQGSGTMGMTNATISSNTTAYVIAAGPASPFTILNSTISNNSGYIQTFDDGGITFKNTIISGNNSGGNNCTGFFSFYTTSLGNNLESGNSCNLSDTSDQVNTDPLLQALGDYGGSNYTHALQISSPAVDTGNDTGCPATDQRGIARPFDGDNNGTATCDIGAFEFDLVALSGVTMTGNTTGLTNSLYAFEATSSPVNASMPISYLWEADGQTNILHKQGGINDSVSFSWFGPGVKTVTVTADNGFTQQVETFDITISIGKQAITDVTVSGPDTGSTGQEYIFSASVSPLDATIPISYTWETDGQSPVIHSDQALIDEVTFSWDDDGEHTVSVTATSSVNSITTNHLITTSSWFVNQATGDDNNDCLSSTTPCQRINAAKNKASSGHTINIASGTYMEKLNIYKNLTFIGAGSDKTFIDGEETGTAVAVASGTITTLQNLTVKNGKATDNGGGIFNNGSLTVKNVIVTNNTAPSSGGGIFNLSSGILTLLNTTISSNHSDNRGAALTNLGQVSMENTTISGNSGGDGPGDDVIQNLSTLSMTNVTVSGNTQGTVLSNTIFQTVTILNSTITGNSGAVSNEGTINCKNTIIADNNGGGANCLSALASQGYNLESGDSCGFAATGDLINTDPMLEPVADNGGATKTHALDRKSPAIDSGDNNGCPSLDQRGKTRPFDGDRDGTAICDIGSYELNKEELSSPWTLFLPAILNNN